MLFRSDVKCNRMQMLLEITDVKCNRMKMLLETTDVKCNRMKMLLETTYVKCNRMKMLLETTDVKCNRMQMLLEITDVKCNTMKMLLEIPDVKCNRMKMLLCIYCLYGQSYINTILVKQHSFSQIKHSISTINNLNTSSRGSLCFFQPLELFQLKTKLPFSKTKHDPITLTNQTHALKPSQIYTY